MDPCPCQSGRAYADCCAIFHYGGEPERCVQLMRARYSAFVRRDAAFLIRTVPATERLTMRPDAFRDSFALDWCGLDIVTTVAGEVEDDHGMVHFRARFRDASGVEKVHEERSQFRRERGSWVYCYS